jgi:hypothetical protein
MADLNALIAQGAQFQAPPDPFVQYGRMQQLQQGQQANQLNQMKMQEMQAANAERNALSNFLPSLNESNRSQLLNYGETGRGIYKTITEGDTQRRLSEQATSQAAVNKSNILKNVIAQTRDAVAGIDPADAGSYKTLRGSVLEQYPELAPYMPEIWDDKTKQRLIVTASSVLEGQKPVVVAPSASVFQGGAFSQAPAAPEKPVQPKLHVVGKNLVDETGKVVFKAQPEPGAGVSSGAPAGKAPSGYRYTPTGDLEPIPGGPSAAGLTNKEIQKREAVLPQAQQAVKTVSNTMSVIGQTVDRLLANPEGINGITGLVFGNTPAVTDKARLAKADLEQLKNLAFIQGLTELRAASKTGAGVGNVSNREGDRFENLKASLDRSQSKADLEAALRRLKAQSEFTIQTMQEAFDDTYSYKSAAPVAPQGTGGFKYLGKESK